MALDRTPQQRCCPLVTGVQSSSFRCRIVAFFSFLGVIGLIAIKEDSTSLSEVPLTISSASAGAESSRSSSLLSKENSANAAITPQTKESFAAKGPLFHIVFTVEKFSTLNLRCVESVFYFHPTALLKIHSNAASGIHASGRLPSKLQAVKDRGFRLEIVPYSAADVLQKAVEMDGSLVNATAAALWASNLDQWKTEQFWYSNESNLLRLCLLYTQGGIYLDTDVILVRPLVVVVAEEDAAQQQDGGSLAHDNAMAHDGRTFHCAVMKFLVPGNHFLAAGIDNFLQNYNGNDWGNNGPRVFHRTSVAHPELICPDLVEDEGALTIVKSTTTTTTTDSDHRNSCWMQPLPAASFQPVPWRQWGKYCFTPGSSPVGAEAASILEAPGVYAAHLNNHLTGEGLEAQLYVAGSVCDILLHKFCITCD